MSDMLEDFDKIVTNFNAAIDRIKRKYGEKTEEVIISPFAFEKCCGDGDEIGIINESTNQILYYIDDVYVVYRRNNGYKLQCKLIPIKDGEQKVGYTYYYTNNPTPHESIGVLDHYCKWLGEWNGKPESYVCIGLKEDFAVGRISWRHWYQVVPV